MDSRVIVSCSGGGVRCVLCGTGAMRGKASLRSHLNGWNHKYHMRKYEDGGRVDEVRHLEIRIDRLGLYRWRCEVQSRLFRYIVGTGVPASVSRQRGETLLAKYEKMERLSLLELAAWKASLTNDPFFTSMDDLDAHWTLEKGFDPVAYKNTRRVTSGITAIIQGVLPFLE